MSNTFHHGDRNKQKLYGKDWLWYRQEPKLWRKIHKHQKRRNSCRQATINLYKTVDYEEFDDTQYPLNTKPWIYYW